MTAIDNDNDNDTVDDTGGVAHLLVPLDLHGCADAVVDRAVWLARLMRARVTLLTVHPADVALDPKCHAHLEGLRARAAAAGLDAIARVQAGAPAEVILAVASAERPTLIVMGTHARSGVRRALFGSVAEAVLRRAPCPVLVDPSGRGVADEPSDEVLQHDAESMG